MDNKELITIFEKTAIQKPFSLSEKSIKSYVFQINSLLNYLEDKPLVDITTKDIKSYLFDLGEISDSSYNLKLASFNSLYKVLGYNPKTEDIFTTNPASIIPRIKNVKQKTKTPLTNQEKMALLRSCKNPRDKAILITYLNTGLRVHELINLTLDQYLNRGENGEIKLIVNKGSYDDEYIFINQETANAIDEYLKVRKECGCEFLFVSNYGNHMSQNCISNTFKTLAKRSGIFSEDRISQMNNHIMRHTVATDLVNKDVAIDIVASFLRHHGLGTVMNYAKTDKERVIEAIA